MQLCTGVDNAVDRIRFNFKTMISVWYVWDGEICDEVDDAANGGDVDLNLEMITKLPILESRLDIRELSRC